MKVLVAFGTKYGSTAQVAEEIAGVIRSKGHEVTVSDLRSEMPDPQGYGLVVLGSSIIVGQWSKGSRRFLEKNAASLSERDLAMFSCSSQYFLRPDERDDQQRAFIDQVAQAHGLKPRSSALFGGEVDFTKYGFVVKAMLKKVGVNKEFEEVGVDTSHPFDFRDWDAIRAWASQLV